MEDAGRVARERTDILGPQLVLLLQRHGVPKGDIIRQERTGLVSCQSVPQHQQVARWLRKWVLQRYSQRIGHNIAGVSREPQCVRDPEG